MTQKLIFTNLVGEALDTLVADLGNPQVFVLADSNTAECVMPALVEQSKAAAGARKIVIKAGEIHKDLDNV